jgi:signal transduction histidine kinase
VAGEEHDTGPGPDRRGGRAGDGGPLEARAAYEHAAATTRLVAGVAHDLGHLLATVALNLEALARRSGEAATRERAARLRASLDDATELVRQLVDAAELPDRGGAARVAGGGAPATDVDAAVAGLASLLRPALGRAELALHLGCGGARAAVASVDLRRCLLNLVLNAADAVTAAGPGGQVTVATGTVELAGGEAQVWPAGRRGPFLTVDVRDSGPGLDPDLLARLAAALEGGEVLRAPSRSTGRGLGLVTTMALAAGCGGALALVGGPPGGAGVRLLLPRED